MQFSIIIPYHFNYDCFFEDSVNSALSQSYAGEYEIIVVASLDDISFLSNHKLKNKKLLFETCLNDDQSSKRNIGLNCSKGKYVIFLDCDDCLNPFFLDECNIAIKKYGHIDLLAFGYTRKQSELSNIHTGGNFYDDQSKCRESIYSNYMKNKQKTAINFDSACMKAFRKSIIDEYNIRFADGLKCAEDAVFVRRFSLYLETIYVDKDFISYFWRYNPNSTMNSLYSGFLDLESFCIEMMNVLENIQEEYKNNFNEYICFVFCEKIRFITEKFFLNIISYAEFKKIIKRYFFDANTTKKLLKQNLIKSFSAKAVLLSMRTKNTAPLLAIHIKKILKR